jgi:EmrB/QacA subfamily drug resistance transporter
VTEAALPVQQVAGLPAWRQRRPAALATLCTILFLTFLDNTIVSVALASIQTDLRAGVSSLQWVVGAYALTFASFMLACGMIGDEFGRKVVMLSGAGVYCGGAAMCALAPNIGVLIAGRAVMGLGAAASEPGTLSMIRHLYTDERLRNRALGVWAAVSGLSLAMGPVLGGALVGLWSWRAVFCFDITFGLAALIAGIIILPENADPDARRVDTAGTLLGAAALAALIFAVIEGENLGFVSAPVIALFCVSAVALAAFGWWENRAPHPLLDLRFLRVPQFTTANIVAFSVYFATFAIFFFTALYLTEVSGYNGFKIAGVFLPMTAVMVAASLLTGRWTSLVGIRMSMVAGCGIFAVGLLLTNAVIRPSPVYLAVAGALLLTGIGVGICVVPITSAVLSAVPPERSGMAASATNTSREIGAVTGVAILGALVNARLHSDLVASLNHLHIPANFQAIVINALETGTVPANGQTAGPAGQQATVNAVIHAAYGAFAAGLHAALYLSAVLVALAGIIAAVTLRGRSGESEPAASAAATKQ